MRSGVSISFSLVLLAVGCGLNLVPEETAIVAKDDASVDASEPPIDGSPPPPDGSLPDNDVPPTRVTYGFGGELEGRQAPVVAMNELSASKQVYWTESSGTYLTFTFADQITEFYSFPRAARPSSLALLPLGFPAPADTIVAFFTETGLGLFAAKSDTSSEAYGDCTTVSRVSHQNGLLFVAMPSSGTASGTRITSISTAADAGALKCADGKLAYDGAELTGHALSPSTLTLAGLTGAGPTLALAVFTRATTDSTFATKREVTVETGALTGAEEVVAVSDDASTVKLRAPCRATGAASSCLVTLTAKP